MSSLQLVAPNLDLLSAGRSPLPCLSQNDDIGSLRSRNHGRGRGAEIRDAVLAEVIRGASFAGQANRSCSAFSHVLFHALLAVTIPATPR